MTSLKNIKTTSHIDTNMVSKTQLCAAPLLSFITMSSTHINILLVKGCFHSNTIITNHITCPQLTKITLTYLKQWELYFYSLTIYYQFLKRLCMRQWEFLSPNIVSSSSHCLYFPFNLDFLSLPCIIIQPQTCLVYFPLGQFLDSIVIYIITCDLICIIILTSHSSSFIVIDNGEYYINAIT